MKKTTGKVLSLVLSLALVVSSFSATFASASTKHTVSGSLSDTDKNAIYLVNGGKEVNTTPEVHTLTVKDLQSWIFGSKPQQTLETDHHKVVDAKISAISHSSGDRLVKWFDGSDLVKQKGISDDTATVDLQLRSSSVKGHEVLNIQYEGSYTDDNDKEYSVKGTKAFDVYVYDENAAVVGATGKDTSDNIGKRGDLSDDFAQKAIVAGNTKAPVSQELTVYLATRDTADDAKVSWKAVKTVTPNYNSKTDYTKSTSQDDKDESVTPGHVYYTLKPSTEGIVLTDGLTSDEKPSFNKDTDATATKPGLSFDPDTNLLKVTAPVNDYTLTYSVKGSKDVTAADKGAVPANGILTGLTDGDFVTVTAKSSDGKTPIGTVTFTYTAAKIAAMPTDVVTGAGKAPTAALSADGKKITITKPVATDSTLPQYKLGDAAAVDVTGDSMEIDAPTSNCEITLTATNSGTQTNSYKFTIAAAATIGTPVGTAAKASVNADNNVVIANKPVSGATMKYVVGAGTATPIADGATIDLASADDGAVVKVTATIDTKSDSAQGTYTKAVVAGNETHDVTATVKDNASTGSVTFTAVPSYWAKNHKDTTTKAAVIADSKDVKAKVKIDKKILVKDGSFNKIGKYSGSTFLYNTTLDKDTPEANKVKVTGYELNFDDSAFSGKEVTVADKASVNKISGKLGKLTVGSGSVSEVALDDGDVTVDDAKTGNIKTKTGDTVTVSSKATTGDIKVEDGGVVNVNSGKTGKIDAATVNVYADEDDFETSTGDITAKDLTIDSKDSKVSTGTIKSSDADGEITIQGSNVNAKAFDYDYRNTNLKFDDFQGKINAPKNAAEDGATISTTNGDDRVEVVGDADVDAISVEDDSHITFDGKLNVTSIDGAGTLAIGAGKMYIDGDASSTILKLTDANLTKGETVFTSLTDTVDENDFTPYGFTLSKSTGSKTDTFKIADLKFAGVAVNKTSSDILKGSSETFTASAYPGGTAMPAGDKVQWSLSDANDSIFTLTVNADNTATVKAIGYDDKFASEDKCTLKAELVDADGDVVDSDEYTAGECALSSVLALPSSATSDTNGNVNVAQGATYQFKITTTDGKAPTFGAGSSSFKTTAAGGSGKVFFYKITAVGKVGDMSGIYLNGAKVATATVTASSVKIDTSKVTIKAGKTYQFKVTAASKPAFGVGGNAAKLVSSKVIGSDYFFTVQATGKAGDKVGVYVNGIAMSVITIG